MGGKQKSDRSRRKVPGSVSSRADNRPINILLSRCSTITIARTLFVAVQKICDEKIFFESVNLVCIPHTPLFKEKQSCLQASQGQLYHKHIYTEAFRDHKLFTLVCHRKHSVWQSDVLFMHKLKKLCRNACWVTKRIS